MVPLRTDTLLLTSAMLGTFLAGVANRIFGVSLPTLAVALHTDLVGISWALISYQLATTSLAIVFGRLGDVYGRERIYVGGFVAMILGVILCGTSASLFELVIYRSLQGVGAAMIQSTSRVLAMRAMPAGSEGRANGFMTTAFQAGFVVGPPLGGAMADWVSWRAIFFALVPIAVAGLVLTIIRLRRLNHQPTVPHAMAFDRTGAALFVATIVILITLLDRRAVFVFGDVRGIAWLLFGVIIVLFLTQQRRSSNPIINVHLFHTRMFGFSAGALFFASMTYAIHDLLMPFYLHNVLHLTPSRIGLMFVASPVIVVAVSPLAGVLTDRRGPRVPGTLGVITTTGAYLLATTLDVHTSWATPAAVIALTGLGLALFNTPNHAAIIAAAPETHRGLAAGMIQTMFGLAHLIGVSVGGLLFRTLHEHYSDPTFGSEALLHESAAFVAATRALFWCCTILGVAATISSLLRGGARLGVTNQAEPNRGGLTPSRPTARV